MTRLLTLERVALATLAFIAEAAGIDEALAGGKGGEEEEDVATATSPATEDRLCVESERSSNCDTKTTLGAEE